MFNDVLSLRECEELMAGLARCAFPFMCAHGRVSMVPIGTLGGDGETIFDELDAGNITHVEKIEEAQSIVKI
jgi:hypothetical protein